MGKKKCLQNRNQAYAVSLGTPVGSPDKNNKANRKNKDSGFMQNHYETGF